MNKYVGKNIKAVLLDHDDTTVNTIGTKWAQHKHIARLYYGKELTDSEIIEHWGKPLQVMVGLLYGTDDAVGALANNTRHHEEFPKELFDYTVPVLRRLKAAGMITGIITATTRFSLEHDLQLHQIPRELLDYTQTSDDTTHHKPEKEVFDPAIAWLATKSISPSETLYIGDGLHDMKAALGSGFNFLGVETGLVTHQQFIDAGAQSIPTLGHLI